MAPELACSQTHSQALLLQGCLTVVLQLPAFPNGWHFMWEGTPGTAQDQAGLAEGSRVILWVF